MFRKYKSKIEPISEKPFSQSTFILISKLAKIISSGVKKAPTRGICYALTKAWYEHLTHDRDLIKELGYGLQTNEELMFKIIQWQKKIYSFHGSI